MDEARVVVSRWSYGACRTAWLTAHDGCAPVPDWFDWVRHEREAPLVVHFEWGKIYSEVSGDASPDIRTDLPIDLAERLAHRFLKGEEGLSALTKHVQVLGQELRTVWTQTD